MPLLRRSPRRHFLKSPVPLLVCLALFGCGRLQRKQETEIVYVLAKQTFLRDRVAAVSNRVGTVQNGQRLELLERGRRFLKVKTEKGEVGWIEEHAVVNPEVVTSFEQLRQSHQNDPVVATASLRDDGYLHVKPGRDTDRYYLLPEGDKLKLLLRASVSKAVGPQASGTASSFARKPSAAAAKKAAATAAKAAKEKEVEKKPPPAVTFKPTPPPPPPASITNPDLAAEAEAAPAPPPAAPVPMEDWWLVRDSGGRVGWLLSSRVDVDVPDEIAGYAEGQRIVSAYLLQKVDDPESNFPDKQAPEYVTVLNSYQSGLPYDFDQVRVFTWNLKKHRYETAFRQRNLQGYLPVAVSSQAYDKVGQEPTFQFRQGIGDSVTIDPTTGAARPASTETLTYRLEGALVKKVDPQAPPPATRATPAANTGRPASASTVKTRTKAPKHRHHKRR